MRYTLFGIFTFLVAVGVSYAQSPPGAIVLYRPRGANFGLIHYSQGEHPTIYCNSTKVARIFENRKAKLTAAAGTYLCHAKQQQPGALDASSSEIPVNVKAGGTTYVRLDVHFGHLHFVLNEVPTSVGEMATEKMPPVRNKNLYTTVLSVGPQKRSPSKLDASN
jgi:hypothetical protein